MTDLERRLRAALHAAAEQPPPGLMDAVLRRHRRHRVRVGASLVAVLAAAALAVPPVTSALRSEGRPGGGIPSGSTSHGSPTTHVWPKRPVAAAGTVLSGCSNANAGAIGAHWRSRAVHEAGPLWLIDGGHSSGHVRLYVAIMVLRGLPPGSTVVVKVPPVSNHYLRFLYGRSDLLTPQAQHFTRLMRHGEGGVTFVACLPAQQIMPSRQFTDYYGGFLVNGARCVPVQVWVPGRARPFAIHLGACPGR